jgi:hypothetical protein
VGFPCVLRLDRSRGRFATILSHPRTERARRPFGPKHGVNGAGIADVSRMWFDTTAARRARTPLGNSMRKLIVAAVLAASAMAAQAADTTCAAAAAEKKLAGAAKTSFMKKCEKDATATCDAAAAEKKLAGAAKTSFTKKCVKDAVGG